VASPAEFARDCKQTAKALRRLPADLRRELGRRVQPEVAEPLAVDIRRAWAGPHAAVLSGGTKARVAGDPTIVVGGSRPVLSGGANVRQVAFGDEFGGGSRIALVPATARARRHRRRSTQQFKRAQGAVFGTVRRQLEPTFDRWAAIVDDVLKGVTNG
jgi:hypothetical protein